MPALTLHLLSFHPGTDAKSFIQAFKWSKPAVKTIVASRPRHIVIRPTQIDAKALTTTKWDLMLLLDSPDQTIPSPVSAAIRDDYSIRVGVPSKLLASYAQRDEQLKGDAAGVPLTGSLDRARGKASSQNLEVSGELLSFMDALTAEHKGPVTMLNLLSFLPGGKPKYFQYGQEFIPVAGKRGGSAKLVGNVVKPSTTHPDSRGDADRPETEWWNEISIVHYPSIRHFCDMLAGEDYQEINARHRLSALKDTLLLCTTEFDVEEPPPRVPRL